MFPLDSEQLWVLDSVPGEVNPDDSDGEVEKVLHTLNSLPSSLPSRKYALFLSLSLSYYSRSRLVILTHAYTGTHT